MRGSGSSPLLLEGWRLRVGGMAIVEGVLMIGKRAVIGVRKKDEIVLEDLGSLKRGKLSRIPFVRGFYNLYYTLSLGLKALNRSVEIVEGQEMKKGEKIFSIVLAFLLAIGLFFYLPMLITYLLKPLRGNEFLFSLIEGLVRIFIFVLYVWIISFMEDVRRMFMYHGAEHKAINAFEAGDLSVENAMRQSRIHERCGTNFLMIFLISSVLVFSFLSIFFAPTLAYRLVSRVVLIPVLASVSYELLILSSKSRMVSLLINSPGKLLQLVTTREPTEEMVEVAIRALEESLKGEGEEIEIMA